MGTLTTNQEFAVMEMWSTMLSQYVSAMGIVLVVYDYLLTIQDEVCLILLRLRAVDLSLHTFCRNALCGQEA